MPTYTIYLVTNTHNGKIYIGFDSKWPRRKTTHLSAAKNNSENRFHKAIRKYGENSFDWRILYQSKEKEHTLKIMEPFFIGEYNSYKKGYNSTIGGDGVFGYRRKNISKESREWFSQFHKTRKRKKHTKTTKEKISKSKKGTSPWNINSKGIYQHRNPKYSCVYCKRELSNNVYGRHNCNGGKDSNIYFS